MTTDVVVFENRFPSLRGAGDQRRAAGLPAMPRPDGPLETGRRSPAVRPPAGARWSVSPPTTTPRSRACPPGWVRTVLEAWADRTTVLGEMPGIEQVYYCFENRGEEIGVTLSHPHGQIYGYPFVTPRTERMLRPGPGRHAAAGRANLFELTCSR